jgi:hypothetical protein
MADIDWTKPVRTKGDHRRVTVLSTNHHPDAYIKTPLVLLSLHNIEGDVIVVRKLDGSRAPARIDGSSVAHAVTFENAPVIESRFFPYVGQGYVTLEKATSIVGDYPIIEVLFEDGKLVSAEVHNNG